MSQQHPTPGSGPASAAPPTWPPPANWANAPTPPAQGQWQQQPNPGPQPHPTQQQAHPGQQPHQQQPSPYGQPPPQQYHGQQPFPQSSPYGQQPYSSPPMPGQQQMPMPYGPPAPYGQASPGVPQGQMPPGQMAPGQQPPGQMTQAQMPPGQYPGAPGPAQYPQHPQGARPSGLFGQVNHAVASGSGMLQSMSAKFNKKFGGLGMPPPPTGQPVYGQPVYGQGPQQGYGQPAHGQPPPAYGQPPAPGQPHPSPGQQPGPQTAQSPQPPQPGAYGVTSPPPAVAQTPPVGSGPISPPPTGGAPADPLAHSMGKLGLGGAPAVPALTRPAQATPELGAVAGAPNRKWTFVDPVTEQPTPEFRTVATVMFEALNGKGSREGFVDASKILGAWKANGLEEQWCELFAVNNHLSFSFMWSFSQIPHVLVPKSKTLVPPAASFTASSPSPAPAVIPAKPVAEDASLPEYVPALTLGGYINSLFLDFFDDPNSLPDLVRKQCGDLYSPARGHPDLSLYDPTVPSELQKRAKAVRDTAVERALIEIAKLKNIPTAADAAAAAAAGPPAAPVASGGMTPQQYQNKMQALQAQQSINNMLNQTMTHAGHSFNAGASTGVWSHPKF